MEYEEIFSEAPDFFKGKGEHSYIPGHHFIPNCIESWDRLRVDG
jgi:hypothetical protein